MSKKYGAGHFLGYLKRLNQKNNFKRGVFGAQNESNQK